MNCRYDERPKDSEEREVLRRGVANWNDTDGLLQAEPSWVPQSPAKLNNPLHAPAGRWRFGSRSRLYRDWPVVAVSQCLYQNWHLLQLPERVIAELCREAGIDSEVSVCLSKNPRGLPKHAR